MLLGALNNAAMAMTAMTSDLGTISQNISNINTTGYKVAETQFQTLMSEQDTSYNEGSGASPNGLSIYGVGAYTNNLISAQGATQTTNVNTDLSISGQGFFMMADGSTTPSGSAPSGSAATSVLYTRDGAFQQQVGPNGQSYVTDATGNFLLGWQGTGTTGAISASGTPQPISVPPAQTVMRNGTATQVDLPAQATTQITVGANITPDNRTTLPDIESVGLSAYDSLSQSHDISLQFQPVVNVSTTTSSTSTDTSTTPPTVTTVPAATSTSQQSLGTNVWNLNFASSETGATITPLASAQPVTTTNTATNGTVTTDSTTTTQSDQGVTVTFNSDGTIASPKTVQFQATWADGQTAVITVDTSGLTQYGGSTKTSVNYTTQNGYQDGQLQSLSFTSNGVMTGSYTNGQSVNLAQVAIARFASPDSLNTTSGTNFTETVASGKPDIATANSLGASIEGGTLEASTSDLGTEFTNMILAQKAYSMNSQVIQTADQMVETVRDLQT